MRVRGSTGVWELFIPGLRDGEIYKYEIKGRSDNYLGLKSDPYGFFAELRPKSGSIVYDIDRYTWHDQQWMAERATRQGLNAPLAIYEVHLGSWRHPAGEDHGMLNYRD
jgi:1,4-alpha-glucan branching enzyme